MNGIDASDLRSDGQVNEDVPVDRVEGDGQAVPGMLILFNALYHTD